MIYFNEKFEIAKDKIDSFLDPSLNNAKKLIKLCLSQEESYNYRQFANIVDNFGRKDFKKLINGEFNINCDDYEIEDLCNRYKIKDIKNFKLLVLKFLNFQLIFSEWYEDVSKHEYLRKLWLLYPIMHKLNDLDEEDLEIKLEKIKYSEWSIKDKNILKQCISNSPEIKAIQFNNFINHNLDEFNSLINNAMKYKSTFKEHQNMKLYEHTFYNYIKQFVKKALNMKGKVVDSFHKIHDAIENRTIECIIENVSKSQITNQNYDYYFNKMINLMKNEKIINIINSSDQIISGVNISFSFFELSYHVIGLINCIMELRDSESEVFDSELKRINQNFESHKNKIKYISGNDEEDLQLIESILLEIQQDRNEIIKLIENIEDKKKYAELEKKKNIRKIFKNGLKAIAGGAIGAAFSGGLSTIIGSVTAVTETIKIIKNSTKVIVNIKKIKSFKELLELAKKKQKEIDEEIKQIKIIYLKRITAHCPEDIKNQIFNKYLND